MGKSQSNLVVRDVEYKRCARKIKGAVNEIELVNEELKNIISVGETPTSISGEMKHISLSGGYNPPTEIKPDRGLQECAEEDVSKADAHSAARTLERS